MVMSMGVPVLADTQISNYSVTKTVTDLSGTDYVAPAKTFTFVLEAQEGTTVYPKSVDTTTHQATLDVAATTSSSATATATLNNLFQASDYTAAGIYSYKLSEVGTDTDHWDYDNSYYMINVKVTNVAGQIAIAGVTAEQYTDADGDGEFTSQGKKESISFNNNYTAWGNDGDNPGDSGSDTGLVVKKTLSGEDYSNSDSFTFDVTFSKGDYTGNVAPTETTSTKRGSGTITYDTAYQITLTGGQTATFKVPAGVTYTVSETNRGTYSTTRYSFTDTTTEDNGTTIDANTATPSHEIATTANYITFDNSKTANPLTGIVNNYGGLLAVVAIAGIGIVMVMVRRRREA